MVNTIANLIAEEELKMLRPRYHLKIAEYEERNRTKTTQRLLAEYLDVTPQHFNACVNGRAIMRLDKAFKLARFLGCTVDDLYEYKEEG